MRNHSLSEPFSVGWVVISVGFDMREDDKIIIENIKNIIYVVVDIEQCGYGWGGDEYRLTNVDRAAKKILELITSKSVK